MIRYQGCHSTILYILKNENPKHFDEDIHVYGLDIVLNILWETIIEFQHIHEKNPPILDIHYEVDSKEISYFDDAPILNDSDNYTWAPQPLDFILLSDSEEYIPSIAPTNLDLTFEAS